MHLARAGAGGGFTGGRGGDMYMDGRGGDMNVDGQGGRKTRRPRGDEVHALASTGI